MLLQLVEGVGQLIFEVCKGVSKQFHSCADKVSLASEVNLPSGSNGQFFSGVRV